MALGVGLGGVRVDLVELGWVWLHMDIPYYLGTKPTLRVLTLLINHRD